MSIEPVPEEPVKTPQHVNEVLHPEDDADPDIRLHGFPDKWIEYLKQYSTGLVKKTTKQQHAFSVIKCVFSLKILPA